MDHWEFPLRHYTLANGIQVLAEEIPAAASVSVGLWVHTGSQDETLETNGISHFLEHMLFKGTFRRSAASIAQEFEAMGGHVDAFTEKELTCYYLRSLPEHLETGLDVLTDMLTDSQLDPVDIEIEKNVVVEEIKHSEDTPEDLVYDLLTASCWGSHPLGLTILGTETSVRRWTQGSLRRRLTTHYCTGRILVTVAGCFPWESLCDWLEQGLGSLPEGPPPLLAAPPVFHSRSTIGPKDVEQVQLCLAWPGCSLVDEERYALTLLESIVGGGCSSRLFQEIREKRGLAYHVSSGLTLHHTTGLFVIQAASSLPAVEEVLQIIQDEIATIVESGATAEELQRAQSQMRASILLSLEGTGARVTRLAHSFLFHQQIIPLAEVLDRFAAVTTEDLRRLARSRFGTLSPSLAAVGAVSPQSLARWEGIVRRGL